MIGDLLVRSYSIAAFVKIGQFDLISEPDAYLLTASPISENLFGQIVPKAGDEYRYYLWPCLINNFSDPRLCRQE